MEGVAGPYCLRTAVHPILQVRAWEVEKGQQVQVVTRVSKYLIFPIMRF